MSVGLIVIILISVLMLIIVLKSVRVIPQGQQVVVERLGRYARVLDAGLHVLIPFLETIRTRIDMREQVVAFPPQPMITRDNVTMSIDTVLYYQVTSPVHATYSVAQLIPAVEQLTITTLRNVIGSLALDEALTSRERINADLQVELDKATDNWGMVVKRIEVKSIDPPMNIQEAMEKQMRAERDKRAAILTAEGFKQSQILTAEGEKQAAILRAEAEQQSNILTADGERQALVLKATGESEAIQRVFGAIHEGRPTPDLLAYQYLKETLPKVADGQSMKLLMIPSEAQAAMGAVTAMGAGFSEGGGVRGGGGFLAGGDDPQPPTGRPYSP